MLYAANRKTDFESRRRSKNPLVKPLEKGCNFKHRATEAERRTGAMNAKRIRRVALYVRVSTDHETIRNQERELRAVADRHGWEIVATFKDEGISGAKGRDERPGLDKLLQAVARREFDLVAAWSVDRKWLIVTYLQKITFGEMRDAGVRSVLVYCRDHRCSHHVEMSADQWPDNIRLSDVEPGFVCTGCGKRGAEIRPKVSQARMGTG